MHKLIPPQTLSPPGASVGLRTDAVAAPLSSISSRVSPSRSAFSSSSSSPVFPSSSSSSSTSSSSASPSTASPILPSSSSVSSSSSCSPPSSSASPFSSSPAFLSSSSSYSSTLPESFRDRAASLLSQARFQKILTPRRQRPEALVSDGASLVGVGSEAHGKKVSPEDSFESVEGTPELSFVDDLWQYVLGREERKTSLGYDYLVKLLIIGDSCVGKSCLLSRFARGRFLPHRTTLGVDFETRTLDVDGRRVKIQLWDTAGHERFRSVTLSYYRSAMGALVVFDITKRESFESVQSWLRELEDRAPQNVQKVLVGNKADVENRAVSREEARRLAGEHNLHYIETSAKTGQHVRTAFVDLTLQVLRCLRQLELQCTYTSDKVDGQSDTSRINHALSNGTLDVVQLAEGPVERQGGLLGETFGRFFGKKRNRSSAVRRGTVRMQFHRYPVDDYLDSCLDV
ncbi:putative Ras-related protein Rab2BV [Toxoplasma gondii GAB2-2007-GAL-DOM2]|uniref:Putative Ras-related protein Rab2BV n=6 Tax=Toxoplasma gondii TaxID=5811 RepID=S7VMR3_TOXGG|nr:putative Ras-related protein Rab2BV [Toxoplasma gondii GT1]KAF4643230.1 putative Ras-related protein Rab2BV [Toxoplasma gondii]KFG33092.1 putative Ras-related protein Rab2BV [Toxoplasma gondii GAB2-2007-GAL-DOM2]KFG51431.1 putative Ras-related protein Rab2BV [Toxoplasma gondii FOU]KFH04809.1 putative Ras-related protein Rab2BV [Toxoplasma gondii VAND]RQX69121.1 putative Ras-related protein Rab2BV [Toxoplasma gondii CAST]